MKCCLLSHGHTGQIHACTVLFIESNFDTIYAWFRISIMVNSNESGLSLSFHCCFNVD